MTNSADQVRETLDRWLAAFNAQDTEGLFALYDPETVYANANAPLMGIASLKPWYESAFKDSTLRVYFKEETLFEGDSLALVVGKYHFRNLQPEGSSSPGQAGRVAILFRRASDGQWKLAYDMDNAPPDVSPADFE